jgi:hypothetical protein
MRARGLDPSNAEDRVAEINAMMAEAMYRYGLDPGDINEWRGCWNSALFRCLCLARRSSPCTRLDTRLS